MALIPLNIKNPTPNTIANNKGNPNSNLDLLNQEKEVNGILFKPITIEIE